MKRKLIGEQLDVNECIQLLDKAAEYGVVQRDLQKSENIVVYMRNPSEEGYQSISMSDCAKMLARDLNGQTYIRERLKAKGIELIEFAELAEAATLAELSIAAL